MGKTGLDTGTKGLGYPNTAGSIEMIKPKIRGLKIGKRSSRRCSTAFEFNDGVY
jgi:hypothetical protein